jgi:hypothetical protein
MTTPSFGCRGEPTYTAIRDEVLPSWQEVKEEHAQMLKEMERNGSRQTANE